MTNGFARFCEVDEGNVEVHILFFIVILKSSCCKEHMFCSAAIPEHTLTFW